VRERITNPIFKELLKLKIVSTKNIVKLSNSTRDKKIPVYKDLKSGVIFLGKYITDTRYYEAVKYKDAIRKVIEKSKRKKISLIKDFKSDPIIRGDALQLQQVLINVFNNAVDILTLNETERKNIYFSISNNENYAIIEIRDSGIGISPSLLPNIFELYKTTKQGGIGVGLWLSKTIIEHHHGIITATNEPNHGALFKIEIPLNAPLASM
jgi:signal transduction histidine kinase